MPNAFKYVAQLNIYIIITIVTCLKAFGNISNIMNKITINKWEKCSDNNYWVNDDTFFTIVKMPVSNSDDDSNEYVTYSIFTENDCPYAWSTLVKYGASYMIIKY